MTPTGPLSLAVLTVDRHWAIEASAARGYLAALERIDWRAHAEEFEARRGDEEPTERDFPVSEGVAMIPLTGPMTKRPQSFGRGASTVRTRRMVRQATDDSDVKAIALLVDSPGGQVSGTAELAADVARARDRKPTVAYLEDLGASAAYWVASQAGAVFANATAAVGSIGTYMVVEDWSRAAENAGVRVHMVRAGAFKGAGYLGTPITDAHLLHWQHEVEQVNDHFVQAVARGRGWSAEYARAIADGRSHIAGDALALGLIDDVRTLESVLSDLASGKPLARAPALMGQES